MKKTGNVWKVDPAFYGAWLQRKAEFLREAEVREEVIFISDPNANANRPIV